jgi:hypothetical protein
MHAQGALHVTICGGVVVSGVTTMYAFGLSVSSERDRAALAGLPTIGRNTRNEQIRRILKSRRFSGRFGLIRGTCNWE